MSGLQSWSTTAINLPEHSDNAVHTDAGARAAGFERALVAGTSVYAYLTHPPMAAWGTAWLGHGGGELRLRRPVCDGDRVDCVIAAGDAGPIVEGRVGDDVQASLELWERADAPPIRDGERFPDIELRLTEAQRTYGTRAGDGLGIYAEQHIVHPVVWANLSNTVFKHNLVTGPWVHTRSRIFHEGVAGDGALLRVESTLVDRFDSRAGERALVDIRILADDAPVATIEHEAIVVLA